MDPYIEPGFMGEDAAFAAIKRENYLRACEAHAAAEEVFDALPSKAIFQTTDACNLSCGMCRSARPGRVAFMEWKLFDRVSREIFPSLYEVHPTNIGEPLLSPWFDRMIDRMLEYGVCLDLTTNGTLFDERIARMVAAVAREIKVSFDGAETTTFESIRHGADFDAVCEAVRMIASALDERGRPGAVLALQMALRRSNVRELPRVIRLARELGAHRVKAYHMFSFRPEMDSESLLHAPGLYQAVYREAVEVGRDAGVDLRLAEQIAADATEAERNLRCVRCHLPWHESWIDVDGAVYPCHSHGGKALGNVSEGPFRSAWTGEPCRAVRRGDLPACRRCGMNYRRRDPDAAAPYDVAGFLSSAPAGRDVIRWSARTKQFDYTGCEESPGGAHDTVRAAFRERRIRDE